MQPYLKRPQSNGAVQKRTQVSKIKRYRYQAFEPDFGWFRTFSDESWIRTLATVFGTVSSDSDACQCLRFLDPGVHAVFNVWHFGPCTNFFVRVSDTYRKSNQYIGNITLYSITRNGISFFAFKSRIEFCCLKHFALNLLSAEITSPWICSSVSLSWGKQINKLNNNKKNREEGVNLGRFIFLIHQRSN